MAKTNENSFDNFFNHPLPAERSTFVMDYNIENPLFVYHAHEDLEINVVTAGDAEILIQGKTCTLIRGTVLFLRPAEYHMLIKRSDNFRMKILVMNREQVEYLKKKAGIANALFDKENLFVNILDKDGLRLLENCLTVEFFKAFSPASKDSFLRESLHLILQLCASSGPENKKQKLHPAIFQAIEMLEESQMMAKLKDISEQIDMDSAQLSRIFQQSLGMSFVEYRNVSRLERFLFLRKTKNYNLLEAASEAGFGSYRSFYRIYKQVYGHSPRA